jgi:hypothetical protein
MNRSFRASCLVGSLVLVLLAREAGAGDAPLSSSSGPAAASSAGPAAVAEADLPLDLREAPFAEGDFSWLNGSNSQPSSLLKVGPTVLSLYVDTFYAWQFRRPVDHTIFPTTTAPRHNELGFNLASLGIELPPNVIDSASGSPIGQLSLQYGAITDTIGGQDSTVKRGFFLSRNALQPIRTASAGWHFHALHGINLEFGIFPSYVGLESYLPQENWNYTHPFLSDFTPYYFYGGRAQIFPTKNTKIEAWVVNGWQTFGQWHEGRAGGYLAMWRPSERVVAAVVAYVGQEQPNDSKAVRFYSDNYVQVQYYKNPDALVTSSAIGLVADVGYEKRGQPTPSGVMTGYSLTHRTEFGPRWGLALRADVYYDKTRALVTQLPAGSPYSLPDADKAFLGGGFTTTIDYRPSPWLVWRLEYAHRASATPFFSGHQGITGNGPGGTVNTAPDAAPFVPHFERSDDRLIGNVTLRL